MAFFLFILQIYGVSSSLSRLRNVRVESDNMGAVLKWEGPRNPPKDLVYTAEAEFSDDFEPICSGTKEQQCDFGHHISCLGDIKLRVRAELPGWNSTWSNVEFEPQKHTVIGPPTVGLHVKGGDIEMTIKDPQLRVSSLRECYSRVTYAVKYWKAGHETDVSEKSVTKQPHRFWPLESGASYCFQVRVQTAYQNKANYTDPMCEITPGGEPPPPPGGGGALVSSLVAVAVLLPVMLLTAWLIHRGRRFLNPTVSLPPHFKQAPGVSSVFPALGDASTPLPEQYDTISSLYEELPYHAVTCQSPYNNRTSQIPYHNVARQSSYQDISGLNSVWQPVADATRENCDEEPQYGNVVDTCLMPYRNI